MPAIYWQDSNMPLLDIRPDHLKVVQDILQKHVPEREVWAFGSRAKWLAKEYSDLDLCIVGESPLSFLTLGLLKEAFEDSDLPYKVDVVDWASTSESFRKIIERDKVVVQEEEKRLGASTWKVSTVGEFCPFIYGKALPERSRVAGEIPVVSSAGVSGRHHEPLVNSGGVVIGRKGTVGSVTLCKSAFWAIDTAFYVPDAPHRNLLFTYYLLKTLGLEHMNSDSAVPGLNRDNAHARTISVPPLAEQRAIAHILGTLDDKIELNRKQNETLEAMARGLFKAWFVDFEPVRAKLEGRWQRGQSLPGLPAHLYDLFPNRLVESELGEIPQGWELRPVGDFADLKGGKQLEKEKIEPTGEIPVFGGAGVMGYTKNHNADGFVITVGRVGAYCGQFFSHRGKAWVNNNASQVRQKNEFIGEWLFLSLRHADIDVIKKGAAQPFVSNGDIAELPLIWPGTQVVQSFSETVVQPLKKQECDVADSKFLAQLRDTLLPKLISGELRVKDAEAFLKERGL